MASELFWPMVLVMLWTCAYTNSSPCLLVQMEAIPCGNQRSYTLPRNSSVCVQGSNFPPGCTVDLVLYPFNYTNGFTVELKQLDLAPRDEHTGNCLEERLIILRSNKFFLLGPVCGDLEDDHPTIHISNVTTIRYSNKRPSLVVQPNYKFDLLITPGEKDNTEHDPKLGTGGIVAIAVCVPIAVVLLAALTFHLYRRKTHDERRQLLENHTAEREAHRRRVDSLEGRVEDARNCTVCMDKPRGCILLPCKHEGLCLDCAKHLKDIHGECPFCRERIQDVLKYYAQ